MFDLEQHLLRQMAFSRGAFGPGDRQQGVIDHIRKELAEIEATASLSGKAEEWVDVIILGLDGLTRALAASGEKSPEGVASDACALIRLKQGKNERRTWPDWRTAPADRAIEHVRDV